ncbi:hypothetical protein Tco_0878357 [Tanacetum coccineum]|uniref:Uncharacterized protein n=1 Tax=Tanacetum coccineum TaxID=301880 RepID=A0ABQ5C150_9ASTR
MNGFLFNFELLMVGEDDFAGMRLQHVVLSEIKQLAIKIQRISLTGFPAQSIGSSNTDVLDSPCLLVLITGTSQSRQHESASHYKSLFDVGQAGFPSSLECWTGLHEMAMAAFESQYIGTMSAPTLLTIFRFVTGKYHSSSASRVVCRLIPIHLIDQTDEVLPALIQSMQNQPWLHLIVLWLGINLRPTDLKILPSGFPLRSDSGDVFSDQRKSYSERNPCPVAQYVLVLESKDIAFNGHYTSTIALVIYGSDICIIASVSFTNCCYLLATV